MQRRSHEILFSVLLDIYAFNVFADLAICLDVQALGLVATTHPANERATQPRLKFLGRPTCVPGTGARPRPVGMDPCAIEPGPPSEQPPTTPSGRRPSRHPSMAF